MEGDIDGGENERGAECDQYGGCYTELVTTLTSLAFVLRGNNMDPSISCPIIKSLITFLTLSKSFLIYDSI